MPDSGDRLARGASRASFQVANADSEFEHDLKTLAKAELMERYDIDEAGYEAACFALENRAPLPSYPRRSAPIEHSPIVEMPAKVTVKIPEAPRYQATAKGDEVLVIRADQEHSSWLLIPPSARAKSSIGRVAAVGPQVTRCEEGELVLFDQFAAHGKEIELVDANGIPRTHLLLNDRDILLGLTRLPAVDASEQPS
jgi:co-chaperonin GroES (HSP10)